MAINQDISNLPTPPSRSDSPSDFSDKADSFLGSLPTFQSELNTYADQLNSTQSQVNTSESNAEASAQASAASADTAESFSDAAIAVVNAELWDSATVYNETDAVVGSDGNTYRSLINSNLGNNPVNDDGTKWRNLTSAEKAALTKTFISGEEVSLALSSPVATAPVVSATKEVPQVGVTNNSWDVSPDGTNYTLHDTAYSTTLTPSDAGADGTFTLGAGSFAAEDVGKKIVGNGGAAFLTATDGSYSLDTAFNDTSTIASGDWSMFALDVESAAAGLTLTVFNNPYALSASSYTGNSFVSTSSSSSPQGVFFKSDGTKMYITDDAADSVFEYELSSSFDITTATYSGRSLDISSQLGAPVDLYIRDDGLRLYSVGTDNDSVFQYNLSTPWDVSTATYSGNSINVSSQDTLPSGLFFKPDGLKMFVSGFGNDSVFEYNLSTAWDLSTASYSNNSFSVNSQDGAAFSLSFRNDGSHFYVLGDVNDKLFEYSLSTPWDITTASYTGNTVDLTAATDSNRGFYLRQDGLRIYAVNAASDTIFEYSIAESKFPTSANHTAITSTSTNTEFWTDINSMTADDASNDGSVYYAVSTDDRTTWKIIDDAEGAERAIVRNNAGTWEYNDASDYGTETWVAASENDEFYALEEAVDISTAQVVESAYDLENASYDNVSFDVSSEESSPRGLFFRDDGEQMYIIGTNQKDVFKYVLGTAWDISTASFSSALYQQTQDGNPLSLFFKPDGLKMYIVGGTNTSIFEYDLSTAWDLSSVNYNNISFNTSSQQSNPAGLFIRNDGLKFFVSGFPGLISSYSMSTAWDINTASFDGTTIDISGVDDILNGVYFSDDGTKMFLSGDRNDQIVKYNLSVPWDLSTAVFSDESLDLSSEGTGVAQMYMKNNGEKAYFSDFAAGKVFQYSTVEIDSTNRMDAAQLNAVSDANHYTLGDGLDLAVTLTMPDSGSTSPTSDGVSINYDAQVKIAGAILGTDYEWDRPNADTVNFKALSNENFKIRVV